MDNQKILFLRNLCFRTFFVGLILAVLLFAATYLLKPVWTTIIPGAFGLNVEEVSEAMLASLLNVRIVLLFLFLAPGIALHGMLRSAEGKTSS